MAPAPRFSVEARTSLLHPWIVRRVGVHGRAAAIDGLRAQLVVPGLVAVDLAQPVRGAVRGQPRWQHRRARCRPRRPSREQTCRRWPPIGQPPPLSRTSRSPHGGVAPGTPANASRCRRRTRLRRLRHPLRPGAGHRGGLDRGSPHPESRRRRPSRRRGRHRRPRPADRGAHWDDATDARGGRGRRDAGRRRERRRRRMGAEGCGERRDDDEQAGDTDPANPIGRRFVLVCGWARLQSRRRGVASTYGVFDMPAICAGS